MCSLLTTIARSYSNKISPSEDVIFSICSVAGFHMLCAGLQDPDDDVRAVAADAVAPIVSLLDASQQGTLGKMLWGALLDLVPLLDPTAFRAPRAMFRVNLAQTVLCSGESCNIFWHKLCYPLDQTGPVPAPVMMHVCHIACTVLHIWCLSWYDPHRSSGCIRKRC